MSGCRRLLARALSAALLFSPALALNAQGISGTVLHTDRATPAGGVIVQLMNERRDSVLARTTTTADGRFRVRLTADQLTADRRVWLQLLRIGQQPTMDGPHTMSATTSPTVQIVLTSAPVQLAAITVRDRNRCTVRPDSGWLVAQLYEEARKALLASSIAAEASNISARFATFTRVEDLRGRQLTPIQRNVVTRETSRPFFSMSADSLARMGYVYDEGDGTVYRAPDATVLMSDTFASSHCFELVNGTQDRSDFLGVGFRPVKSTRERVDIRGTMWLHRTTGVLESVEFSYDPLAPEMARARIGGVVEFARTDGGLWFVKHWELRMPRTVLRRVSMSTQSLIPNITATTIVEGLNVTGGDVQSLSAGPALLYAMDGAVMSSSIASTTVVPTETTVSSPDPGIAPTLCSENSDSTGTIRGRVVDQSQYGIGDVRVSATYKLRFRDIGDGFTWQTRTVSTRSAIGGSYTLCALPLATTISLEATPASARSSGRRVDVQLLPESRHVERNLSVNIAIAQASFTAQSDDEKSDAMDDVSRALPTRLADFDKRAAARGPGAYVTRSQILRQNPGSVIQILRNVSGVTIADSLGVRRAVSARGRVSTRETMKTCEFPIVVDNVLVLGLEQLQGIRPQSVYGVEVYLGPASIPHQLIAATKGSWCGLIAVWTIDE